MADTTFNGGKVLEQLNKSWHKYLKGLKDIRQTIYFLFTAKQKKRIRREYWKWRFKQTHRNDKNGQSDGPMFMEEENNTLLNHEQINLSLKILLTR